jgi:alpha-glucosidase
MPGEVEPELYLRWIQWGIFSPILRTHTTKNPEAERRIWAYPEPYSDLMRACFVRRYAMQPYIYTEARKTYDTGLAFLRPLYYDWPEAPEAYGAKNEYMFGDSILADPITQPVANDSQLAKTSVWLPSGDWIEWDSGAHFHGPATVERTFSLSQIPLYVKAGSIIPMQRGTPGTGDKPADPLILTIFPLNDGQVSEYPLYEDSGDTPGYQNGERGRTVIRAALNRDGSALNVRVAPVEGRYKGMQTSRAYELRLPGSWPPSSVTINGKPLSYVKRRDDVGWRFEGNSWTTVITTGRLSVTAGVTITLRSGLEMARDRALLDDFAGRMTRLREAYDILNANWPVAWSPDSLIAAMQTGDRIGYHPGTAFEEMSGLQSKLAGLANLVEAMHATETSPAFFMKDAGSNSDHTGRRLVQYNAAINIALAHLEDVDGTHSRASIDKGNGKGP